MVDYKFYIVSYANFYLPKLSRILFSLCFIYSIHDTRLAPTTTYALHHHNEHERKKKLLHSY